MARFFTMTGRALKAFLTIEERTPQLEALWKNLGGREKAPLTDRLPKDVTQDAGKTTADDTWVLDQAMAFPKFVFLYTFGDMSDYCHKDGTPDHSRADCALAAYLALFSRDVAQIDCLFRSSALMRPKWDKVCYSDGHTYGEGVIWMALRSSNQRKDGERLCEL